MKEAFLWILIGYMVLDIMAIAGQWIMNRTIKITGPTVVLVIITHGLFILGAAFVLTGEWT